MNGLATVVLLKLQPLKERDLHNGSVGVSFLIEGKWSVIKCLFLAAVGSPSA